MKTVQQVALGVSLTLLGVTAAHAAVFTNAPGETPFSLTLDSQSAAWTDEAANLASTAAPYSHTWQESSAPIIVPVQVDPQPGVAGSLDVYSEVTVKTYESSGNTQQATVNYAANIADPLAVPQTFNLLGMITAVDPLISAGQGYLTFDMGLGVGFESPYTPGSVNGALTFQLGNAPGSWTHSFQTTFDSVSDNIRLTTDWSSRTAVDFNTPVYFAATYDIAGASIPFQLHALNLDVFASLNEGGVTLINTEPFRQLLAHYDLAPLPTAVPLPAAGWLLLTGLGGLAAVVRRKAA